MTTPQTEQLAAGRELDAEIAETVFGATSIKEGHVIDVASWTEGSDLFAEYGTEHLIVPKYSTDIAAAWQVVERRVSAGYDYEIGLDTETKEHYALFLSPPLPLGVRCYGKGTTAPLAICLAALKAVQS